MTRTEHILTTLNWRQGALGAFLGVDQSTVSCLCAGRRETGPISRLLDQLERAIASGIVVAGMTPEDATRAVLAAVARETAA